MKGNLYGSTSHRYVKQDDGTWRCYDCGDTAPESRNPPCRECGARQDEKCRLDYCVDPEAEDDE